MSDAKADEQRVLLISKGQGLSTADAKALKDAGYVVVRVKFPSDVRLLQGTMPPMTAGQMLQAALIGYASTGDTAKARAWTALCNLVIAETEKEKARA